jgi:hypothetical protein
MAEPNIRQKIIVLDINAGTEQYLKDRLTDGYVLHQIVPLESLNKLLIVYYDPAVDEG